MHDYPETAPLERRRKAALVRCISRAHLILAIEGEKIVRRARPLLHGLNDCRTGAERSSFPNQVKRLANGGFSACFDRCCFARSNDQFGTILRLFSVAARSTAVANDHAKPIEWVERVVTYVAEDGTSLIAGRIFG